MVSFDDIKEAYKILDGVVKCNSLKKSKSFSEMTGSNVFFKMENLRLTGSFKIRGVYNKISHLSNEKKKTGC